MIATGRCLCGQAKYRVTGAPIATAVCHCKNCQRQSGSAFSIVAIVASDAVEREGEWKSYEDTAESGAKLLREFCPNCGSALASMAPASPGLTVIKAGTLDDTSSVTPQMHLWTKSAQSWVALDPGLPQFSEQPSTF